MVLLLSGFCDPLFSVHFKHHVGFPRSNGGRILRSDLTPEIYPPLQCVHLLSLFRSDGPHTIGNFGWHPMISDTSPPSLHILLTWKNFDSALIPLEPTLFLFVLSMHTLILPYSLLYFPSMISIRYLLIIFQQNGLSTT
jgi:hypothetical protein